MAWYLIHSKPAQEARAAQNLEQQGFHVFLPWCKIQRIRRGKLAYFVEPLFARYLFIELDNVTSNWYPIRSTRGVHALVRIGSNTNQVSVPDYLIKELKILQEQSTSYEKPIIALFEQNQILDITSRPFVGLSRLFRKLQVSADGQARVLLLVEILAKPQSLSIDLTHMER